MLVFGAVIAWVTRVKEEGGEGRKEMHADIPLGFENRPHTQ